MTKSDLKEETIILDYGFRDVTLFTCCNGENLGKGEEMSTCVYLNVCVYVCDVFKEEKLKILCVCV